MSSAEVVRNLENWAEKQRGEAVMLANNWAGKLESEAKRNRPWQDRTGNARKGLMGRAALENNIIFIRLAHSVEYGVFLELARDGRHAILKPTRDRNVDRIVRSYERLFS